MRGIDRLGSREEERFGSGVVCSEQWDEIGERGEGRRLFMATAKRRGGEGIPCRGRGARLVSRQEEERDARDNCVI